MLTLAFDDKLLIWIAKLSSSTEDSKNNDESFPPLTWWLCWCEFSLPCLCRYKECKFSSVAENIGVLPSNRFAFLMRIPFCRRTNPDAIFVQQKVICVIRIFFSSFFVDYYFWFFPCISAEIHNNITSFHIKSIFYVEKRKFILKCKKKQNISDSRKKYV